MPAIGGPSSNGADAAIDHAAMSGGADSMEPSVKVNLLCRAFSLLFMIDITSAC